MTTSDGEIAKSWAVWRLKRNRRGLRVGLFFMVTLYPAFGLLDWALAPPSALPWIWGTRAAIGLVALVLLVLMRSPRFDPWVDAVAVLCGWLALRLATRAGGGDARRPGGLVPGGEPGPRGRGGSPRRRVQSELPLRH